MILLSLALCTPVDQTRGTSTNSRPASLGQLAVFDLSCHWKNAADDALITQFSLSMLQAIDQKSKAACLFYPFVFMDDAGPGEDPFVTYGGGKSLARLRQIRQKYDASQVYQRLMPSGFKLGV